MSVVNFLCFVTVFVSKWKVHTKKYICIHLDVNSGWLDLQASKICHSSPDSTLNIKFFLDIYVIFKNALKEILYVCGLNNYVYFHRRSGEPQIDLLCKKLYSAWYSPFHVLFFGLHLLNRRWQFQTLAMQSEMAYWKFMSRGDIVK